jgi:hypothetical protein
MTILTPEIKTILIPVDGSVHARKAALVGAAIAAKFGARVVLLHILLRNISLANSTNWQEPKRFHRMCGRSSNLSRPPSTISG